MPNASRRAKAKLDKNSRLIEIYCLVENIDCH
jgi:hypothetical protein